MVDCVKTRVADTLHSTSTPTVGALAGYLTGDEKMNKRNMAKSTTYTVTVGDRSTRVRVPNNLRGQLDEPASATDAARDARDRAIRKLHGAAASWWTDNGVPGYGQVIVPCATGGSNCITARIELEIRPDKPFPVDVAGRAKFAAEWDEETQRSHGYVHGAADARDSNVGSEE